MELLAKLIHLFFGKKDTAIPNEESYESVDGELFSSPDDLDAYEEEQAIRNAKYILKDDPIYGTLTWSGQGRRPKWIDDYVNRGGSIDDLAVEQSKPFD